jgi:hypothetical protein
MKPITFIRSGSKGQSFVELSLVALLLMLLVAGIAEFGVLLNRYLNMLDGAREAARYGANYDPWAPCANPSDPVDSDGVCTAYYINAAKEAEDVIAPIALNANTNADPLKNDDIVISIFVVANGNFCRYPSGTENGWSWSKNVEGLGSPIHTSAQSSATIQSQLNASTEVSALLVEIFYNYAQTLKAPFYEQFFPDPVPVYIYAIMPLKTASPPSGPCYVP